MKSKKKTWFWTVVAVVILAYAGKTAFSLNSMLSSKKSQYNEIEKRKGEELLLKSELEKQQKAINSDEYIEKMAREKLGMVKKGEKVFVDINR